MDIESVVVRLRRAGVVCLSDFEKKLVQNARDETVVRDLLAEGTAALMFAAAGFEVEMSDRPDLLLRGFGQSVGAEVKHFRFKQQDGIDDMRLKQVTQFLAPYGDTVPLEGKPAWDQVVAVAQAKARRLKPGGPHLLVIQSSSTHCIDDGVVLTAANVLNEAPAREGHPYLSRLNGLMLMSREHSVAAGRSVYFFDLSPSEVTLLPAVRAAVDGVREWNA